MTQNQYNHARQYGDEDVLSGEVVRADEDESDEDHPQQTYLHKVASAARPAGDLSADDEDAGYQEPLASGELSDEELLDGTDQAATAYPAGTGPATSATSDTLGTPATLGTSGTPDGPAEPDEHTAPDDQPGPDGPIAAASPDAMAPQAGTTATAGTDVDASEQRGRHRADLGEESLLADGAGIRAEWMHVQAQFVDDPRVAVTDAANIITNVASRLEAAVKERQQALRGTWDGNGQADTEALRVTMQQYRILLDRLTSL